MTITAREAAARLEAARRADDDDDRWELLWSITEAGPAVVRALAEPLLADPDLGETMLGADLVSAMPDVTEELRTFAAERRLPVPETPPFSPGDKAALALLLRARLTREDDADVLDSLIIAAGKLHAAELLPDVLAHLDHADPDVRHAIAWTLPALGPAERPSPPEIIAPLLRLGRDPAARVRDWATFGLGMLQEEPIDTPQTRALFRENADDEDEDVRQEARAALEALGLLEE